MPTLIEFFWHSLTLISGVSIGVCIPAYLRMRKPIDENVFDPETECVVEYIYKHPANGPMLVRKPFSEWPSWADSINPLNAKPEVTVNQNGRNYIGQKD